jgi:4-hydroxybenzoate polyprenyltransferase
VFIGVILGGYALYSLPPLRLKRVPLLGRLLVGVNTTAAALAGFTLFGGEVTAFPPLYILFFCGPFALATSAMDLGDVEADRASGIKTLPAILGPAISRWIIGLFAAGAYVMMGLILADARLVALVAILGVVHVYVIVRRPFRDDAVLSVNLVSMLSLAVVLGVRLHPA